MGVLFSTQVSQVFTSVRAKSALVIAGALALTVGTFAALESARIARESRASFYRQALAETVAHRASLETKLSRAISLTKTYSKMVTQRSVTREVRTELEAAGIHATGTVSVDEGGKNPRVTTGGGERRQQLADALTQVRVPYDELLRKGHAFGKTMSDGAIPVLIAEQGRLVLAILLPRAEWLEGLERSSTVLLTDSQGRTIARRDGPESPVVLSNDALLPSIHSEQDPSALELTEDGKRYVAASAWLADRKLTLIQLYPASFIHASSKQRIYRVLAVAAFAFFAVFSISFLIHWKIFATASERTVEILERVEEALEKAPRDEPSRAHEGFSHPNIRVSATPNLGTSEMPGSWWQTQVFHDELFILVGEVRTALLDAAQANYTAASVQGALSLLFHMCGSRKEAVPPSFALVTKSLKHAMQIACAEATMRLWAMRLNLSTGDAEWISAGFEQPIVAQTDGDARRLVGFVAQELGATSEIEVQPGRATLKAGDVLKLNLSQTQLHQTIEAAVSISIPETAKLDQKLAA